MYAGFPPPSRPVSWYASYSIDPSMLPTPPELHYFSDQRLEAYIFTPKSAYPDTQLMSTMQDPSLAWESSERLEWLGDHVLKALTADLLNDLFPNVRESELSSIRDALMNKYVYAYAAKRLKLHRQIIRQTPNPSEDVLGCLFAAYIGGVYTDLGSERWHILRQWYQELFEPFALQYKSYFDHWRGAQDLPLSRSVTPVSSQSHIMQRPIDNGTLPRGYFSDPLPSCSARRRQRSIPRSPSSSAFYSGGGGSSSSTSGQYGSESTVELKEWTDKQHRKPPEYYYESNGQKGDYIRWNAIISLDGRQIAHSWARTKKEAQHSASRKALDVLRGRHVQ